MPDAIIIILTVMAGLIVVGGAAVLMRSLIEPYLLDIDREILDVSRNQWSREACPKDGNLDSGDRESEGRAILRVSLFSDIHGKGLRVPITKLLNGLFSGSPDAVLFAGDIADSGKKPEAGLRILRLVAERAKAEGIPCYAARGNHDLLLTRDRIESTGFRLLENEFEIIRGASGAVFLLIGPGDSGKKSRIWPQLPGNLPADIPPERRIVLVHNPDYVRSQPDPAPYRVQLSGHIHGGQILLPFNLQFTVLRGDLLPREGIVSGFFSRKGVIGYITRGVGCGVLPLRFMAKPQITHLEIRV